MASKIKGVSDDALSHATPSPKQRVSCRVPPTTTNKSKSPKTDSVVFWLKQVPDPVARLIPVFWVPE